MIEAIRRSGIKQVLSLNNFDLPADFFEKEIMMLGSSTDLQEKNNHLEGEISGISASNIPFWFKGYYKPGEEIAQIDDWDERVEHIAKNAKNWDIGALSGIPAWIELMMQKVIEYHSLNNIHEIWPNLQVYTSGGVAFGPKPRSYSQKVNSKMRQLALKRALVNQASEGTISLIEEWSLKSHKTKDFSQLLTQLGTSRKTLIIDESVEKNLFLAARNLSNVKVSTSSTVNALDIVGVDQVLCSVAGITSLVSKFSTQN